MKKLKRILEKASEWIEKHPKKAYILLAVFLSVSMITLNILAINIQKPTYKPIHVPYNKLLNTINHNVISKLTIEKGHIKIWTADGKVIESKIPRQDAFQLIKKINKGQIVVYQNASISTQHSILVVLINFVANLIPIVLMVIILAPMLLKGSPWKPGFLKNKIKFDIEERPNIKLDNVAGIEEVKQEILDIVEYLKNPSTYTALGGRAPKGVLLYGEPGVGKTYLAKALSGEANVPFIHISGSEFIELFVGLGASRVRELFNTARELKPCIIFIDEIDAIGQARGGGMYSSHSEREQTLNQLLVEMDGFSTSEGILIIGATNRPDVLDPALLRPGRFDRQILIPKPDVKGRLEILKAHAKGKRLAPDVDLETIARSTPGFTGADLENLLNEAAIIATRLKKKEITQEDLESALDKIMIGLERKGMAITEKEKEIIAFHEAGHTIMSLLKDKTNEIHKVSIIPRGFALGITASLPTEDKYLTTKEEIISSLYVLMGGRASEEVFFGKDNITTGAANDIERATELAYRMIGIYGMSDNLGPITLIKQQNLFLIKEQQTNSKGSTLLDKLDEEVTALINKVYQETLQEIQNHKEAVQSLAKALIEKETLNKAEIMNICGKYLNTSR